jgi:hypothetical protein
VAYVAEGRLGEDHLGEVVTSDAFGVAREFVHIWLGFRNRMAIGAGQLAMFLRRVWEASALF